MAEKKTAPGAQRGVPTTRLIARGRTFLVVSVNWLTSARDFQGQYAVHRAAQADFNVRGWQGRWRYTAPTALFFAAPPWRRNLWPGGFACIRRLLAGW